jgi:hypothetical protein
LVFDNNNKENFHWSDNDDTKALKRELRDRVKEVFQQNEAGMIEEYNKMISHFKKEWEQSEKKTVELSNSFSHSAFVSWNGMKWWSGTNKYAYSPNPFHGKFEIPKDAKAGSEYVD